MLLPTRSIMMRDPPWRLTDGEQVRISIFGVRDCGTSMADEESAEPLLRGERRRGSRLSRCRRRRGAALLGAAAALPAPARPDRSAARPAARLADDATATCEEDDGCADGYLCDSGICRAEATDDNAALGKGADDMTDEKSDDQPDIIPHSDDATTCTQLADRQFGQYCKCDATSSEIMNVTCLGVCEADATNATTTTGPNATRPRRLAKRHTLYMARRTAREWAALRFGAEMRSTRAGAASRATSGRRVAVLRPAQGPPARAVARSSQRGAGFRAAARRRRRGRLGNAHRVGRAPLARRRGWHSPFFVSAEHKPSDVDLPPPPRFSWCELSSSSPPFPMSSMSVADRDESSSRAGAPSVRSSSSVRL